MTDHNEFLRELMINELIRLAFYREQESLLMALELESTYKPVPKKLSLLLQLKVQTFQPMLLESMKGIMTTMSQTS